MSKMVIDDYIPSNETIIWSGRPDKKCMFFESIFNSMLIFALLWGIIDFSVISLVIKDFFPDPSEDVANPNFVNFLPILIFFGIHLMPVWIYLGGIIHSVVKNKSIRYVLTDKSAYFFNTASKQSVMNLSYIDLQCITLKRGFFDKRLNVGDILFERRMSLDLPLSYRSKSNVKSEYRYTFHDISDFAAGYRIATEAMQQEKGLNIPREKPRNNNYNGYGSNNYGNNNYSNNNYGNDGYGNDGYGNNNYGNNGYGNNNYGSNSYGNNGYGNNGFGDNNDQNRRY